MRQYQDIKLNLSTGCSNVQQEHDPVPTRKTEAAKSIRTKMSQIKNLQEKWKQVFF